jgi:hypothetical protein
VGKRTEHAIAFGTEVFYITKDFVGRGTAISNGALTSNRRKPVGRARSSSRSRDGTCSGGRRDEEEEAESHEKGKDRKGRHFEVPST